MAELIILFVFTKEIGPAEKTFLVFANILIIAGCLGEWEFGGSATAASEKIQSIANTKAADAILNAAAANERTAKLNLALEEERLARLKLLSEVTSRHLGQAIS